MTDTNIVSRLSRPPSRRSGNNRHDRHPHPPVATGKLRPAGHQEQHETGRVTDGTDTAKRTSASPQNNGSASRIPLGSATPRLISSLPTSHPRPLDRREWSRTEAEIRVARASLFAAQALARGLIADGCDSEVQGIREFISAIVPDSDADTQPEHPSGTHRTLQWRAILIVPMPASPLSKTAPFSEFTLPSTPRNG